MLIGAVPLAEAVQTVELESPSATGKERALDVLVAGAALPPNPGELVESHAMETVLERVKAQYDLVVIDTPPLTAVSDAFPLLGKVDGVVIVGRVGRVSSGSIRSRCEHVFVWSPRSLQVVPSS